MNPATQPVSDFVWSLSAPQPMGLCCPYLAQVLPASTLDTFTDTPRGVSMATS